MKNQALNPFLPSWEYVPDGEPHIFHDRVYLYGSHDRFGAPMFCVNDYVCWSAPVDDLSAWKYEGVIYQRKQDPTNRFGIRSLYAPDVVQGTDGKYYLYYAFDFLGRMGVACADSPAGPFAYYGCVRFMDGHIWGSRSGEAFAFDPGVLVDDDGSVWLYSGFATKVPAILSRGHRLQNSGGVVLKLDKDMLTVLEGPTILFPLKGREGCFLGHAFFEASSIRKADGKYYFVYSSEHNHELCYAVSDAPSGPFAYGGTLVDIGDLYQDGRKNEKYARNYLGNTHGGLLKIRDEWYIFYHRQTNRTSYARQACAEKLIRTADGGFLQSEVTSCGLNDGPLCGIGTYEARIACNLQSRDGVARVDRFMSQFLLRKHPYFTQSRPDRESRGDQYIANMRDGATAGFKYFDFRQEKPNSIMLELSGNAKGIITVSSDREFCNVVARIECCVMIRSRVSAVFDANNLSVDALYFRFNGKGKINFHSFRLEKIM